MRNVVPVVGDHVVQDAGGVAEVLQRAVERVQQLAELVELVLAEAARAVADALAVGADPAAVFACVRYYDIIVRFKAERAEEPRALDR